MKSWWPWLRCAAALLGTAAVVRQFWLAVSNARDATTAWGSDVSTVVTNFFSYFTILSNLSAVIALLAGAVWMLRTRHHGEAGSVEPLWLARLFVGSATCMVVTGVVYNLLLRSVSIAGLSDAWTNEVLHVVMPLVMLIEVLFAPRRRADQPGERAGTIGWVLVFPLLWVVWTMVRGELVTAPLTGNGWWYPYPFLDPHHGTGGLVKVGAYVLGIGVVLVVVATALARLRGRDTAPVSTRTSTDS